jgi:uncharacterized protein (TIGR02757 family)
MAALSRAELERLAERAYARFNRREHALGDPVSFTYGYDDPRDAEVAGLVAALLAFGRLAQIMRSVGDALGRLGPSPCRFILDTPPDGLRAACEGFVHRTVDAGRLACLLHGIRDALEAHGSLQACFLSHDQPGAGDILPGLTGLAAELARGGTGAGHLIADPLRGSPCKRWNLFLRWMVRSDEVDPGLWRGVSPARLIIPLDAHMWRVCTGLGLTRRATCTMRAALEVTDAFRAVRPEDPVRYDFCLMHASVAGELARWMP